MIFTDEFFKSVVSKVKNIRYLPETHKYKKDKFNDVEHVCFYDETLKKIMDFHFIINSNSIRICSITSNSHRESVLIRHTELADVLLNEMNEWIKKAPKFRVKVAMMEFHVEKSDQFLPPETKFNFSFISLFLKRTKSYNNVYSYIYIFLITILSLYGMISFFNLIENGKIFFALLTFLCHIPIVDTCFRYVSIFNECKKEYKKIQLLSKDA